MYYIYILTNQTNTVMYIGMTNDLRRRLYEHKKELIPNNISKPLKKPIEKWIEAHRKIGACRKDE